MLNAIPILGWLIDFLLSLSLAIIFYPIWSHLAPTYFYFIPKVYQNIPFWDCVGLFMIIPIVKKMLTPTFVSVSQTNNCKDDSK